MPSLAFGAQLTCAAHPCFAMLCRSQGHRGCQAEFEAPQLRGAVGQQQQLLLRLEVSPGCGRPAAGAVLPGCRQFPYQCNGKVPMQLKCSCGCRLSAQPPRSSAAALWPPPLQATIHVEALAVGHPSGTSRGPEAIHGHAAQGHRLCARQHTVRHGGLYAMFFAHVKRTNQQFRQSSCWCVGHGCGLPKLAEYIWPVARLLTMCVDASCICPCCSLEMGCLAAVCQAAHPPRAMVWGWGWGCKALMQQKQLT